MVKPQPAVYFLSGTLVEYKTEIVSSCLRFDQLVANAPVDVVADVENRGKYPSSSDAALLGVAIAFRTVEGVISFYVALCEWNDEKKILQPTGEAGLAGRLSTFLARRELVGHNCEHDRDWIESCLGITTKWHMDTRVAWHLSDGEDSLHGFGLKTAQTTILGWSESNDVELLTALKAAGGKDKGSIYLVPTPILGKYACLDAVSTLLLCEHLTPFFEKNAYWQFLWWRMEYHKILTESTRIGTPVNLEKLLEAKEKLVIKCDELKAEIRVVCAKELEELENAWATDKANGYKRKESAEKYLANPEKWKRFNPNSSTQTALLFHGKLGIPVTDRTPTGRPKQDRTTVSGFNHPVSKAFVSYSEAADTLEKANSYLEGVGEDGRIRFPYDYAATVSGRLGGYKPYALNMPFSEMELMSAFEVPEGMIGIHADLRAIEPCLIAAFSDDPTLVKIYRDDLGDVYLDLALKAFPNNVELKELYNPNEKLSPEVKKHFERERNICKIVHLAVGYTGTAYTVAKNIRKAGYDISDAEAKRLVRTYWSTFSKVADFDFKLKKIHERDGYIRNMFGRILRVPEKFKKDTMNRFIQSSGHDVLTEWVKGINLLRMESGIKMFPVLADIHDSSSWAVEESKYEVAKGFYEDSLRSLNSRLGLSVTIRAEIKSFRTFAGLKGNES